MARHFGKCGGTCYEAGSDIDHFAPRYDEGWASLLAFSDSGKGMVGCMSVALGGLGICCWQTDPWPPVEMTPETSSRAMSPLISYSWKIVFVSVYLSSDFESDGSLRSCPFFNEYIFTANVPI